MRTRLRPGPPEKGTTAKVAETGNLDLRLPLLSSNGQLEIPGQRALKGALSRGCQLRTAPSASSLRFCCSGLSAEALIAESVDKVTERFPTFGEIGYKTSSCANSPTALDSWSGWWRAGNRSLAVSAKSTKICPIFHLSVPGTAAKVRDVRPHPVTGEEAGHEAETGCTDGNRYFRIWHAGSNQRLSV
jgi:hypothetical protein